MDRCNRRSQPGIVEIGTNAGAFEGRGAAWGRRARETSSTGDGSVAVATTLRLVGCEPKASCDTPRLGHWGRSIARSENRRMEHLARVLGLRSNGSQDWPPAAA